jgi:hypothetical protein
MQLTTLIFIVALPVVILAVYSYINKDKVAALNKLSEFGGIANSYLFPSTSGEYKGTRFTVSLTHPRYCTPLLKVNFYKGYFINLMIFNAKVYSFTRFIKKTGLFHPLKTGDEAFDNDTLIFCSSRDLAKNYLNTPEIKQAVKELFDEGFERLFISAGKIFIQKQNYSLALDLDKAHFEGVLDKLDLLSKGIALSRVK